MKKYVVELNYYVTILDSKEEALKLINDSWYHLTPTEREKQEYYQAYEIEVPEGVDLDEVSDLTELMTEKLVDYKEDIKMYCVANDNGELIAHDIQDKAKAQIICENMKEQEPDAGWEVLEQ